MNLPFDDPSPGFMEIHKTLQARWPDWEVTCGLARYSNDKEPLFWIELFRPPTAKICECCGQTTVDKSNTINNYFRNITLEEKIQDIDNKVLDYEASIGNERGEKR